MFKININYKSLFQFMALLIVCPVAFADSMGLGNVASNVMEPVTLFNNFIDTGCFLVGGSFIFASIIKYFEHRRSPLMVPLSTVVFLFIAGVILVLLPFASYLTSSGIPYGLFN